MIWADWGVDWGREKAWRADWGVDLGVCETFGLKLRVWRKWKV